jgi:acetoacetyl-CoA synthetase
LSDYRPPHGLAAREGNSSRGQTSAASASTEEKIARIWGRVLGSAPKPEDNFFDAGGDPSSAVRLFEGIRAEFGRTIPPLAIYTAPTVLGLARVVSDDKPVQFSNALLLRAGSQFPPVFLVHGLGGNVMEFSKVMRHTDLPFPVYGLQARGSDGLEPPLDRIDSMAAYHLDGIRKLQSQGPYVLCGYSLGGLVALEIARQLTECGETILLLSMIDSYPHATALRTMERIRLFVQRARHRGAHLAPARTTGAPNGEPSQARNEKLCGPAVREVAQYSLRALKRYRPRPYLGKVFFLRAQITTVFPADPVAAWDGVIRELAVETVPGDHHGMLQSGARAVASAISRRIREGVDRAGFPK